MLTESDSILNTASPTEVDVAEILAHQFLVSELMENLIPSEAAERTIAERKTEDDEIWRRAVHGALQGLRAAAGQGFRLTRD